MQRTPLIAAGFGLAIVAGAFWTGRLAADDARIWPTTTAPQQQPSFLDTIGSGTKSVFTSTADVLTLKKFRTPAPATTAAPLPPAARVTAAAPQQKSWWQKTFGPKDPPPPRTVKEWLSLPRSDP